MVRKTKTTQPLTTVQQLGSLIKSARDIMRKDKGLSGDLDRLPMLTWIMFLKFLGDLEQMHEQEAIMAGKRFRSAIEPPYRWRDWAAKEDGMAAVSKRTRRVELPVSSRPGRRRKPGHITDLSHLFWPYYRTSFSCNTGASFASNRSITGARPRVF